MHRPWHIAAIFGVSLALLLAATGWITRTALRYERAEAQARRQAALEEQVRLALWRMDSALAAFIAQERSRPYFVYSPFYPAEGAYTRMFNDAAFGEVLMPSPLLAPDSPFVRLYFQFGPEGEGGSPQVPTGRMRDLALATFATPERMDAAAERLRELNARVQAADLLAALPAPQPAPGTPVIAAGEPHWTPEYNPYAQQRARRIAEQPPGPTREPAAPPTGESVAALPSKGQAARSDQEFQARAQNLENWVQRQAGRTPGAATRDGGVVADVQEGVFQPVWLETELLLARRIALSGREYVQGCWLDWTALRLELLASVQDLIPGADLEPADGVAGEAGRLLAGLPVRLIAPPPAGDTAPLPRQVWLPLSVAWGCVLLAAGAVGLLLIGTVALSERRAAFVSAVTHELRTPLTTFRLYTEMLADGLVRDEAKRWQYLKTLQAEALRLGHLVDNVLAYARLERRARPANTERVAVAALLDPIAGRLRERAVQAGMELCVESDPGAEKLALRADPPAVEQILFNLVDNACKYASRAEDRRIHLRARPAAGDRVEIAVCDHGPGLGPDDLRRLFRPFQKSARDAANSAPGVGLGLALSRRLARAMRGDLRLVQDDELAPESRGRTAAGGGACFVLSLPGAAAPAEVRR